MKRLTYLALLMLLLMQLSACGTTGANSKEADGQIETLQGEISRLEQENQELRDIIQGMDDSYQGEYNENSEELLFDAPIDIEIDCPDTIENNGYTLSVKDTYVKCCNTNMSTYEYDGYFMYITVEITDIPSGISEDDAYIFLTFDMYDENNRYIGQVTPLSCGPLTTAKTGTVLNGDSLLTAYDVVKLVYTPY